MRPFNIRDFVVDWLLHNIPEPEPRWKWNGQRHFAPFSKTPAGHRRRVTRQFVRAHKEQEIRRHV